jgi:uncharacterized protein (TIGR02996 family)
VSEDEAFIAAILQSPDDVTVRLVYADLLDERGEGARARLIRAAGEDAWPAFCEVHQSLRDEVGRATGLSFSGVGQDGPETPYLSYTWRGAGDAPARQRVTFYFRHGFIEVVRCPAAAWAELADALLAAQPVRKVVLADSPLPESLRRAEEFRERWAGIAFVPADI